eukprot:gene4664-849_t
MAVAVPPAACLLCLDSEIRHTGIAQSTAFTIGGVDYLALASRWDGVSTALKSAVLSPARNPRAPPYTCGPGTTARASADAYVSWACQGRPPRLPAPPRRPSPSSSARYHFTLRGSVGTSRPLRPWGSALAAAIMYSAGVPICGAQVVQRSGSTWTDLQEFDTLGAMDWVHVAVPGNSNSAVVTSAVGVDVAQAQRLLTSSTAEEVLFSGPGPWHATFDLGPFAPPVEACVIHSSRLEGSPYSAAVASSDTADGPWAVVKTIVWAEPWGGGPAEFGSRKVWALPTTSARYWRVTVAQVHGDGTFAPALYSVQWTQDHYLVVANERAGVDSGYDTPSHMYRWDWQARQFYTIPHQTFPTVGASSVEAFSIGSGLYLAIAEWGSPGDNNRASSVWRFNADPNIAQFEFMQPVPTAGARDFAFFTADSDGAGTERAYLAVANSINMGDPRTNSVVFQWSGNAFDTTVPVARFMTQGASDLEPFAVGSPGNKHVYLAVANHFDGNSKNIDSQILAWDPTANPPDTPRLNLVHSVKGSGAYEWESLFIDGQTYLFLTNMYDSELSSGNINSVLYKWAGPEEVLEVYQELPTLSGRGTEHFRIGSRTYLTVANSHDTHQDQYWLSHDIYVWREDGQCTPIPTPTALSAPTPVPPTAIPHPNSPNQATCRWSNLMKDTYLAGCDTDRCRSYGVLSAAQAACLASPSCGGVTGSPTGSNWQLRTADRPQSSASNEESYYLMNYNDYDCPRSPPSPSSSPGFPPGPSPCAASPPTVEGSVAMPDGICVGAWECQVNCKIGFFLPSATSASFRCSQESWVAAAGIPPECAESCTGTPRVDLLPAGAISFDAASCVDSETCPVNCAPGHASTGAAAAFRCVNRIWIAPAVPDACVPIVWAPTPNPIPALDATVVPSGCIPIARLLSGILQERDINLTVINPAPLSCGQATDSVCPVRCAHGDSRPEGNANAICTPAGETLDSTSV